jgi:APA family basic amino acid/polyamine antiporter
VKGKPVLQRKLSTFDVTNLVVGSIIGADIYVAAAIGSQFVGPASLLVWLASGIMAMIIALSFAHCATLMPKVGGPYAYAKEVAGSFSAFEVGWGLFLAEWFSLAVFPIAFAQYFCSLIPGIDEVGQVALKGIFIVVIFSTNILGVKAAGRFNDALTIAKLAPLFLLTMSGLMFIGFNLGVAGSNLQPFVTGDAGSFGQALVLIFWAYAGFELSTMPADEIERPERTIPKAIVNGMLIVMAFYFFTNLAIIGSLDQSSLSVSKSPLIDSAHVIFGSLGGLGAIIPVIVGIGALISILGADESGTIGTSRLGFAMSADGLFPKSFSILTVKSNAPIIGLAIICSTAFIASLIGGLTALISTSVFLLAFCYFATSVSTILLEKKLPQKAKNIKGKYVIPIAGMAFSILLMALVTPELIIISIALLIVGVPIYVFFSPKKEREDIREIFLSRDAILRRTYEQGEKFLAYPLRKIKVIILRRRNVKRAWTLEESSDDSPRR